VIILAVPYQAIDDAITELGDGITGKTIVDVTNALTGDMQLASAARPAARKRFSRRRALRKS
jgi:predicted dinucleotide-binding enzyme